MRAVKRWLLLSLSLGLAACGIFGGEDLLGPTLDDLQPARLPDVSVAVPQVTLDAVEANYRRALETAEDPVIRRKVLGRLAGLEMTRAEQHQLDATEGGLRFFDEAIALYRELIALPVDVDPATAAQAATEQDAHLYQLAKAYALDGRMDESAAVLDRLAAEQPESSFIAEAQFRRAERAFSRGNYAEATRNYSAVMAQGRDSNYYSNSVYMHGWSLFKRSRYEEALVSFTQVLDVASEALPADNRGALGEITGPQKNLVTDTLHVMGLVFSYLDGATSIAATYETLGERPYNHLLYQHLGDLYLDKRRYRDSAATYKHYVEHYPDSEHGPDFNVRMIDVYTKGNFPSLLLPAKESFVRNYGIHSDFWAQKGAPMQARLRPHLHIYIDELAKYEHAQAQKLKQLLVANSAKLKPADKARSQREADEKFVLAAHWYQEFAETFPDDPETPNRVFLMAESLFEARQWPEAFAAYERVAYEYLDDSHGADAGYSAILAATEQLQALRGATEQAQSPATWATQKTASALKFADYYGADKRAPKVLTQAAKELLEQGEPVQAIAAATRIAQWQPQLDADLRRTAWLVIGQSQFDTENYAAAEQAYQQVLALMSAQDPARASIVERIAASLYRGAEQQIAANDKAAAVQQLLRIRELAPESEIAITGQYDAVNYLMELGQWSAAQRELADFRSRYPQHALTATLATKAVLVFEQLQDWGGAAGELSGLARTDKDPQVRRQSLYLAAEYFEKAGDKTTALKTYRDYANTYPEPLERVMEARFKLTALYADAGESEKRRFWLRKLIDGDNQAKPRTDRSRYLGAFASSEIAEENYQAFARIPLKLPLKRSLKSKKKALKTTLNAYQGVLGYEVAEFTTLANYRIGSVYAQLSRDLMDSERPANLDALALEQYDILLEEQAFPFEELAIEVHQGNAQRSWDGIYDAWVKRSFTALAKLLPGRYQKQEKILEYADAID